MTKIALPFRSTLFGLGVAFGLVAPLGAAAEDISNSPKILTKEIQQVVGPRRSIMVDQITASGHVGNDASGWDVTGGLATMLTTALTESNRFVVVDRVSAGALRAENELTKSAAASGTIVSSPAHVVPAQYLINGMVTQFSTGDSGSSGNIGGGGLLGGSLSIGRTTGKIAIDLHVVSTRTMAVVGAFTVQKEISNTNIGFSGGYNGMTFGGSQYWNTPLGGATREALTEATNKIAEIVAGGRWEGMVAQVEGDQVYINAGAIAGLGVGDELAVERTTKTITDPGTGEILGDSKTQLGVIEITSVQQKYAIGHYRAVVGLAQRGDVVVKAN